VKKGQTAQIDVPSHKLAQASRSPAEV
jgi:hypothetical protein